MVSLAPRLRLLAVQRRHQHAAGKAGPSYGLSTHCADAPTPSRHHPVHQSFEQLHPRCVAVVVDPIQSVKGKVVIDAFRLINPRGISQ